MELIIPTIAGAALLLFAAFVVLRLWRGRKSGISIRMQVFVAMAAVSGGFAAVLGLIAIERLEVRSTAQADAVAKEEAELVAQLIGASGQPFEVMARRLAEQNLAGDLRVEIFDRNGQLIHRLGQRTFSGTRRSAPVRIAGSTVGEVQVIRPTLGVRQILRDVAARAAVLSLLLVIGTASAAALTGRAIAKPIERLTGAASRIAHGEPQAVLPPPVGREVRTLTAAVESMRKELEGRHIAERLAADLSHQLKNPVAAIRASAEVLSDGALEEPEAARRFVARILEATERVLGLVNNLLALTRLQARGVEPEMVDVGELAALSAESHAAQAHKRRVHIEVHAAAGGVVRGDSAWIRRAIDNLVDNALEFADPAFAEQTADAAQPPCVSISVRNAESCVVIEVGNYGPGIDPRVRDRMFERFVTTRKDTGGSGLGLAIVAAVAEQHGGSVEVVSTGPPRTLFRLTIPRAPTTLHKIFS